MDELFRTSGLRYAQVGQRNMMQANFLHMRDESTSPKDIARKEHWDEYLSQGLSDIPRCSYSCENPSRIKSYRSIFGQYGILLRIQVHVIEARGRISKFHTPAPS